MNLPGFLQEKGFPSQAISGECKDEFFIRKSNIWQKRKKKMALACMSTL